MLRIGTAIQRAAQAGQRDLEDRRKTLQRFAARAGDAVACRHQLSVGRCRGSRNRDRAQIAAPVCSDDRAQIFIGRCDVARSRAARGGGEYAVREDRAAVRVDAARGAQHARLGGETELLQLGESCIAHPCCRDRDEVAAQREQAAHKGRGIHVAVRAVVAKADQPRLGVQRQLLIQAAHRQQSNMTRDAVRAAPCIRLGDSDGLCDAVDSCQQLQQFAAATSSALDARFTNTR